MLCDGEADSAALTWASVCQQRLNISGFSSNSHPQQFLQVSHCRHWALISGGGPYHSSAECQDPLWMFYQTLSCLTRDVNRLGKVLRRCVCICTERCLYWGFIWGKGGVLGSLFCAGKHPIARLHCVHVCKMWLHVSGFRKHAAFSIWSPRLLINLTE